MCRDIIAMTTFPTYPSQTIPVSGSLCGASIASNSIVAGTIMVGSTLTSSLKTDFAIDFARALTWFGRVFSETTEEGGGDIREGIIAGIEAARISMLWPELGKPVDPREKEIAALKAEIEEMRNRYE